MARNRRFYSPPSEGPTWFYQVRCNHDGLLYVGIASDMQRRISQHRATKSWWPDVDYVFADQMDTRAEALGVEARAIRGTMPPRNIAGKPRSKTDPTVGEWMLLDARGYPIQTAADLR